jgi:prepilin-type N-terminal cleavage/methylation domain-containing protein
MTLSASCRGFTLVETLVATGILVTALAGIAQLLVLASQLTLQAGASGAALRAAQDKIESLRSHALTYDDAGDPLTSPALRASSWNSLVETVEPFLDWVDRDGRERASPEEAVWLRRWRITPLDAGEPDAIAIEVCVFSDVAGDSRHPDACLSTIRTRQP